MKTAGILILVIGLGLTLFTGFTYFTKEKVVDIGSIEITRDKPHHVNVPLLAGLIVMVVGGVMVWQSEKVK